MIIRCRQIYPHGGLLSIASLCHNSQLPEPVVSMIDKSNHAIKVASVDSRKSWIDGSLLTLHGMYVQVPGMYI
jgi:hypothetical protein